MLDVLDEILLKLSPGGDWNNIIDLVDVNFNTIFNLK